jgi:hypothetical protein
MDETANTVTTEASTSTETSDLADASLKQDEESPNPLANRPSSISGSFDLERRESTDSNFSLRPSYKQK